MEMKWNSERLTALIERAGISQPQVALSTGISLATIHAYCMGRVSPGLSSLMALADFFAVPLDYLCGRCTEEEARGILDDYSEHFMALRRAPYEAYLVAGRQPLRTDRYSGYESPWPYNLVDAIVGEPIDWVLTEDCLAALDFCMETLSVRERTAILLYYQKGRNLDEVGREFNVTRERIRQVIRKGVRKMQHPSHVKALRVGLNAARETESAEARLTELESQNDRLERKLAERRAALDELTAICADIPETLSGLSTPVIDLGMSVRSTNCLWRAGYDTLGKVVDAAEEGKLKGIRNLGRKSLDEILAMLRDRTGKDYRRACV